MKQDGRDMHCVPYKVQSAGYPVSRLETNSLRNGRPSEVLQALVSCVYAAANFTEELFHLIYKRRKSPILFACSTSIFPAPISIS
jgi:hypothetical protein